MTINSNIETEGKDLLEKHHKLFNLLINIPKSRKMIFRIDNINGNRIGKPRFEPAEYLWPPELFNQLRDHLQDIWNFFEKYSYWFDESIMSLLHWEQRRISKHSIVYLLQHDAWGVVFGDYLIEIKDNETIISYFRFEHKIKSFSLGIMDEKQIENWICRDSIRQITERFTEKWRILENEINTCISERYHKKIPLLINSDYLKSQIKVCKQIRKEIPEASLLLLGRIAELWLLIGLKMDFSPKNFDLISEAEEQGILDNQSKKLLLNIRNHYNRLKHQRFYNIADCKLDEWIELFEMFLK